MIVRWGLDELPGVLRELEIAQPFLVASSRWDELGLEAAARWNEIPSHRIEVPPDVDGVLAVGGGSAIDTAKAVSAATGLPLVAVPTTYSGSEWTPYFGMRDEARRAKTGGSGANTVAVAYEPAFTFDLPREESVGTAMNALAHCAEALYAGPCEDAAVGAHLIATWLPVVAADGSDLEARTRLLEGAMHGGMALAERGLFLAHAMAQALGGRYGVSHGAMNALCLAPALRFNEPVVPEAIASLASALEVTDVAERVEELARLGGYERLRDFGIPEDELSEAASETAQRPAARSNPRPATAADIELLLRSIW